MAASYRTTEWSPSIGSLKGLNKSEMDMVEERLNSTEQSVLQNQDMISSSSSPLCGNAFSATSYSFNTQSSHIGGYENAAGTTPRSYQPHTDTLSFGKASLGLRNEMFYRGNSTRNQSSMHPYPDHFAPFDSSNQQYPVTEQVRVPPEFHMFQENSRHAYETTNSSESDYMMQRSMGNFSLRSHVFEERRDLNFNSFRGENMFLPMASTRTCMRRHLPNDFDMGPPYGVAYNRSFSASSSSSSSPAWEIDYNLPPLDRFFPPSRFMDAKFFVIKSYSEDNVHKSIKHCVWASTKNGNKKLDSAYREAKKKEVPCPVFLLFSVNASAQFCGVAEMVGPVDFNTSVEYWQQDRWSGHFPVKWLIVKDVPNSLFRHIILENNDNKPVTNSRDTQEVGVEQGTEMLEIFKRCEMRSSILNDFSFYEERQRGIQHRKARQRALLETLAVSSSASYVPTHLRSYLHDDIEREMSKSFAEALALQRKPN